MADQLRLLSSVEIDALRMMASNRTSGEAAAEMCMSTLELAIVIGNVHKRLQTNTREEAVQEGIRRGYLPPREGC